MIFTKRMGPAHVAFTLIELLIVVAIIAILAAIAVPNFLEAQVRAKVSRAKSDIRSLATAIEAYHVDNNEYPEGTDNPARMPQYIVDRLGTLAPGYYSFCTRETGNRMLGVHFFGLTTPISYITSIPLDPFTVEEGAIFYAYRNAKATKDGWILTSVGPDTDLISPNGKGTTNPNPLSTMSDTNNPSRLADINERAVIHFIEGTGTYTNVERAQFRNYLEDLTYDPSNGTVSDGDLYRHQGTPKNIP